MAEEVKEIRGRPEKPIDWEFLDELLLAGCTGTECASHFDIHPQTFYTRVKEKYGVVFTVYAAEKKEKGISILRFAQYKKAIGLDDKPDNTMLIWLGKQRMGQKENQVSVADLEAYARLKEYTAALKQERGELLQDKPSDHSESPLVVEQNQTSPQEA